ncbi:hypothetical protein Salat_1164800 [Sesamum alatum]|uniref:Uncharacterized protein n=1 Tax=Sesamum alatum TaxID=300844 RepID=A0AAE1YE99_9LAMI|nr:hypothetical protein Salat_1164800 [Sesamum alatum]
MARPGQVLDLGLRSRKWMDLGEFGLTWASGVEALARPGASRARIDTGLFIGCLHKARRVPELGLAAGVISRLGRPWPEWLDLGESQLMRGMGKRVEELARPEGTTSPRARARGWCNSLTWATMARVAQPW